MRRGEGELLRLPSLFPPPGYSTQTSQLGLSGFVSPHLLFVLYLAPFRWRYFGREVGLFRVFNKRETRSELGSFVRPALGRTSTPWCWR